MLGIENPVHFDRRGRPRRRLPRRRRAADVRRRLRGAGARPGDLRPRGRDELRGDGPRRPGVRVGRARLLAATRSRPPPSASRSRRKTARASTSSRRTRSTRTATRSCAAPGPTSSGGSEMAELNVGDQIPELRVTPDKYLPHRYAGASGDFNPIHIDDEFAKAVGLPRQHPPRPLLDGPRRQANAAAGRRRPAGAEAALGPVPRDGRARAEIVVSGTVKSVDGDRVVSTPSPPRARTRRSERRG